MRAQYTLRRVTRRSMLSIAVAAALAAGAPLAAHDIPRDVTVHAFVKPEGNRLLMLVRVPLGAMRDIQFPQTSEGNLDVARAQSLLHDAVAQWIAPGIEFHENGTPVAAPSIRAVRVSLPSDRSFVSFEDALRHTTAAAPDDPRLPWNQAMLDTLLEYPVASDRSRFSIRPGFERLAVNVATALRFVTPDGTVRAFDLHGDPGFVHLDPRWHQAAWTFVRLGLSHILDGIDHLLFLLCLVVPFRQLRPLIVIVTAFTAAHSVALVAAASGWAPDALWFPPLVETLIAASILYMAIENAVRRSTPRNRGLLAFGFGLIHGFGFSFALNDTMQFAGSHLVTSLFAFNAGVEIGQVLVLLILVPALELLFRSGLSERVGTIVISALVGHVAWHWMAERWSALRQFPLPAPDAALMASAARVALAIVAVGAVIWLASLRVLRSRSAHRP